jgi:hypothetical protein
MRTLCSIPRLILAGLLLTTAGPLRAWTLEIGRLRSGAQTMESIELQAQGEQIRLRARSVDFGGLDMQQSGLSLDCVLSRPHPGELACAGNIGAQSPAWKGSIKLEQRAGQQAVAIQTGGGAIRLRRERAPDAAIDVDLRALPLHWARSRLQLAWPELAALSGQLHAQLRYTPAAARLQGTLKLVALEFDSTDAELAGAGLQMDGTLDLRLAQLPELRLEFRSPRGQLLLGPVYLELPEAASLLGLWIQQDRAGNWQLPLLSWTDPEGLALRASVQNDVSKGLDISLSEFSAQLDATAQRYLGAALANAGFQGLQLSGSAQGQGRFVAGQWQSFALELQQLAIRDPQQRIEVARIDGSLNMDAVSGDNELRWRGARLFQIPLGDATAYWRWTPQQLALTRPLRMALLGGSLQIPKLERRRGEQAGEWHASIELDQIDMLNLATALDWPEFTGSLSGRLPGLVFRQGGFVADGDLELSLFDGSMRVSKLSSERSFGVAPTLGADIEFDNLQLKQLSSVLDFGEVEGWLDGRIDGLRLVDWAPVAFDARVRTDLDYPGKKRISQRAVQGLSSVGGGGSASNPIMRMFDSFPYAEIGLSCRLAENVCAMGGLAETAGGYTILRGAGIPRLTVVGHQRKVDWPVLLARLRAVSSGQAPVIGDGP